MVYLMVFLVVVSIGVAVGAVATRVSDQLTREEEARRELVHKVQEVNKIETSHDLMLDFIRRLAQDEVGNPQIEALVIQTDVEKILEHHTRR